MNMAGTLPLLAPRPANGLAKLIRTSLNRGHGYPLVPSHHLPELSRRLGPFFEQVGVQPRRVP
jgi:hypothetical protein